MSEARLDLSRFNYNPSQQKMTRPIESPLTIDSDSDDEDVVCLSPPITPHLLTEKPSSSDPTTNVLSSTEQGCSASSSLSQTSTASTSLATPTTPESLWLSKQNASQCTNTHNNANPCANSFEMETKLNGLVRMFPSRSRATLRRCLQQHQYDVGKSIEWLTSGSSQQLPPNGFSSPVKRTFSSVSSPLSSPGISGNTSSQESQIARPAYKRQRCVILSDSDEEGPPKPSYFKIKEDVSYLSGMFTDISEEVLEATLVKQNYDVEKTERVLQNAATSATKNVGSIKAFQETRKAKAQVSINQRKFYGETKGKTKQMANDGPAEKPKYSRIKTNGHRNGHGGSDLDSEDENFEDEQDVDYKADEVLSYINEAEPAELLCIPGCSQKKADILLEIRPFNDWDHLTEMIFNTKLLSMKLIEGCKQVLHMREEIQKLMKRCERLAKDMEDVTSQYGKSIDTDRERDGIVDQPTLIPSHLKLKPYQMVGLNWLTLLHARKVNGILADEMGLGKTIQTIAFLTHLLQQGEKGPHVVIAPSSTLDNWLRELQLWCPTLQILLYYGTQEERADIREQISTKSIEEFHVLLTTYTVATISPADRALFRHYRFHYAIFDEGHMLKNMTSQRYKNLMKVRAERRLLLTGTPLQNNLVELMSLLCFVMPELFEGKTEHLRSMFTNLTSAKGETSGTYARNSIARAQHIMKPFVLRRLKTQVLKQLPTKHDTIEHLEMGEVQRQLYESLKTKFSQEMEATNEDGSKVKNGSGASMLMQLRQASNHPLLHRSIFDDKRLRKMAAKMKDEPTHVDSVEEYIFEDMQVMSDFELHTLCQKYKGINNFQLSEETILESAKLNRLDELLPKLKEEGARVLIFSQFTTMMNILEVYLQSKEHSYLRLDGTTPVVDRQGLIDLFTEDDSIFIFMLSTKAGGMGINLTAANTVIIHDIDFNPYNDKQAEDRCHRVGQTRDVNVYRLITKCTVEEAMLKCAAAKLRLEQDLSNKGDNTEDIAHLLKSVLKS